jgi:methylaspartate mutase sigma subunit
VLKTKSADKNNIRIVLGVIGSDCHAVGNQVLDHFFREMGFAVTNLGVMVSQDEFLDAAIETGADAILVSSLYGHGEMDCAGFRERAVERGLGDIVLYVGGNLVVGKKGFKTVSQKFRDMGFDRVFPPDVELEKVAKLLKQDVSKRSRNE